LRMKDRCVREKKSKGSKQKERDRDTAIGHSG